MSVVGGEMTPDLLANNVSINSIVKDSSNNLYVSGSWTQRCSLYQSWNGTGVQTNIIRYPTNDFSVNNTNYNGFLAKLSIETGEWVWIEPLVGNGDTFLQRLRYSSERNTVYVVDQLFD